ncbi:hypothetical protein LX36DRAFT_668838 [Colletotrichum falcatum]|nr:hypothetical protein LX36DRAFT_668838 [Colletotrichum falcatum]
MLNKTYITVITGVIALGTHAATTLALCNADNATITAGGTTATDFPARARSACGTVAGKYISACGCGPTRSAAPTPMPTPCPAYGGFGCGLSPWAVEVPDSNASTTITYLSSDSGRRSLEAKLLKGRPLQESVLSVGISSGVFSVRPNVPGKLTFALWLDNMDARFVGVKFNGTPLRTVDARDGVGWGVWKALLVNYTPSSYRLQVTF